MPGALRVADTNDTLAQGIAALKAGQKAEARNLLGQAVRQDPKDETAWLWLSGAVESDQERRYCMERILKLNPNNTLAQQALEQMQAPAAPPTQPARPTVLPPLAPAVSTPPIEAKPEAKLPPPPVKVTPKRKPNRLLIAIGVGLLCVACVAGIYLAWQQIRQSTQSALVTDPTQAARIGREIVDYTTPPNYTEMAPQIPNVKTVIIAPKSQPGGAIFTLTQMPSNNTLQEAEKLVRQILEKYSLTQKVQPIVVGTQQINIKGKPVTLTISEGKSGGQTVRQMMGTFPGKTSSVLLMIWGVTSTWDQKLIDGFLASIR